MDLSDITATDLQDEIIAPIIIKENREQGTKRLKDGQYMNILSLYYRSVFQNSESFVRTDLIQDDISLVSDEYNSSFNIYELEPCFYIFKDLSEALYSILKPEDGEFNNSFVIGFDDITRKTNLVVRPGIIAIKFDDKSFFSTILGFEPYWDPKHFNKYAGQKIINLSSTDKIQLKCDVIDGSVVNGIRGPKLYTFVLD